MVTLNKAENFMRLINGDVPEYIPVYSLGWGVRPPIARGTRNPDGTGYDMFGVPQVMGSGIVPAPMPKTSDFILTDITKWRDVVKVPDLSDVNWEIMAKEASDRRNPELPWGGGTGIGVFQTLVALMGFTEGLIACNEEPEEVKAMLSYITDFMVENAKKFLHYYRPEFGTYGDDIAHERNPFISLEMFRDIFAPCWRRYYAVFAEAGIHCTMHNCGHFEELLDDTVNMGVWLWEPAQSSNDLYAAKDRYGNRLAICEGFEVRFFGENTTEEEVRALYRQRLERLAAGGGYAIFEPAPEGVPSFTPRENEISAWGWDEFEKLRYSFYN
jgi:uroporphyrinogen-III decarboxylase